jgi:hypothetical protein
VCPRKSAHILNIFVGKTNRVRSVLFSQHETATKKVFSPPFSISLHFDLSSVRFSHNVHLVLMHAHIHVRSIENVSYVKTLTVPLSCGENLTLLALFIVSIKMFRMCALNLGYSVVNGKCMCRIYQTRKPGRLRSLSLNTLRVRSGFNPFKIANLYQFRVMDKYICIYTLSSH